MITTQEYFNKGIDELLTEGTRKGETLEESLLSESGKEVIYFDDEKEMKEEEKDIEYHLKNQGLTIKDIVLTINERIAVILH